MYFRKSVRHIDDMKANLEQGGLATHLFCTENIPVFCLSHSLQFLICAGGISPNCCHS